MQRFWLHMPRRKPLQRLRGMTIPKQANHWACEPHLRPAGCSRHRAACRRRMPRGPGRRQSRRHRRLVLRLCPWGLVRRRCPTTRRCQAPFLQVCTTAYNGRRRLKRDAWSCCHRWEVPIIRLLKDCRIFRCRRTRSVVWIQLLALRRRLACRRRLCATGSMHGFSVNVLGFYHMTVST